MENRTLFKTWIDVDDAPDDDANIQHYTAAVHRILFINTRVHLHIFVISCADDRLCHTAAHSRAPYLSSPNFCFFAREEDREENRVCQTQWKIV